MAKELSNLKPVPGSTSPRTRIGRGQGSGLGKTAGRGTKGQKARSGASKGKGFEGGQIPLRRRLPKYGFTNIFAKDYTEVNVGDLSALPAGTVVDASSLKASGIISRIGKHGVKLLGNGEVSVALVVDLSAVSAGARAKIEAAGGRLETQGEAEAAQ
jgi:large subunit ribosomal protein L15